MEPCKSGLQLKMISLMTLLTLLCPSPLFLLSLTLLKYSQVLSLDEQFFFHREGKLIPQQYPSLFYDIKRFKLCRFVKTNHLEDSIKVLWQKIFLHRRKRINEPPRCQDGLKKYVMPLPFSYRLFFFFLLEWI